MCGYQRCTVLTAVQGEHCAKCRAAQAHKGSAAPGQQSLAPVESSPGAAASGQSPAPVESSPGVAAPAGQSPAAPPASGAVEQPGSQVAGQSDDEAYSSLGDVLEDALAGKVADAEEEGKQKPAPNEVKTVGTQPPAPVEGSSGATGSAEQRQPLDDKDILAFLKRFGFHVREGDCGRIRASMSTRDGLLAYPGFLTGPNKRILPENRSLLLDEATHCEWCQKLRVEWKDEGRKFVEGELYCTVHAFGAMYYGLKYHAYDVW
jgi:hypothetical protein